MLWLRRVRGTLSTACGGHLPNSLSPAQIREFARRGAALRIEEVRQEIAAITALLTTGAGGRRPTARGTDKSNRRRAGRRTISAAGRAAIAAAQKARWAKIKAQRNGQEPAYVIKTDSATAKSPRERRKMSPAARKAAADRMRKYWADRRKAGAKK